MKRHSTIGLEDVKEALRRGLCGTVENNGGFCVYVDEHGRRQYVVDDDSCEPVSFDSLGTPSFRKSAALRVSSRSSGF